MTTCPHCQAQDKQVKAGRHPCGNQRYLCRHCQHRYTPEPKSHGYAETVRARAIQLHLDGLSFHQIGRQLQVVHQTVANWVTAYADQLPEAPELAQPLAVVEQDELFTFVGSKKHRPIS